MVDASAVYSTASTAFTDGAEFGRGAAIGISTQKLHARGPMGLEEQTTYKCISRGDGQIGSLLIVNEIEYESGNRKDIAVL